MKVLKWVGIVFSVLIVIGIIASSGSKKEEPAKNAATPAAQTAAPAAKVEAIKISAASLYATYKENEVAADEKYKGKAMEITGTIDDIKKGLGDIPYVTLATDDDFGNVQCTFSKNDSAQLAELKKGQKITITGKCSGLMMNVIVKDSKIQ